MSATKVKMEFRNIRSLLMKVHSNWKRSGQGEKDNDDIANDDYKVDEVIAAKFHLILPGRHGSQLFVLCMHKVWVTILHACSYADGGTAQRFFKIQDLHPRAQNLWEQVNETR